MAYRELFVVEVREVLRLWLAGHGSRGVAAMAGVDRKTARGYVAVAQALGLERSEEAVLSEELVEAVCAAVRPGAKGEVGEHRRRCREHKALVEGWVAEGCHAPKLVRLLHRHTGVLVPLRTMQRFVAEEIRPARRGSTVPIADPEPGQVLEPGWGKPKYVRAVLAELDDSEVVALGDRCLRAFPGRTSIRLQDALWWIECRGVSRVTPITRQALADAMDGHRLHPDLSPGEFLAQHAEPIGSWGGVPEAAYTADGTLTRPPAADPFSFLGNGESAAPHEPVGHHWLFERFGYLSWPDKRLFRVLEALVHPTTRRGAEQSTWVERIDGVLAVDGFEVRETEQLSGHPAFRIEPRRRGGHRRPKNLIFASTGLKPELGFSDALDDDVVILGNADTCLFYDDPVGDAGLPWSTLVGWWARSQGLDPTLPETRKALGERLLASVGSPPERRLFASYFRRYAEKLGDRLPALLPQVYLHYDPATLRQLRKRGLERRFLAQRMDFLMLLPRGVRVVLEVDGQQHYSTGMSADAKPSPSVYSETVRADRDLRLAGYEVYRFGGAELSPKATEATVQAFFDALLGGLLGDG